MGKTSSSKKARSEKRLKSWWDRVHKASHRPETDTPQTSEARNIADPGSALISHQDLPGNEVQSVASSTAGEEAPSDAPPRVTVNQSTAGGINEDPVESQQFDISLFFNEVLEGELPDINHSGTARNLSDILIQLEECVRVDPAGTDEYTSTTPHLQEEKEVAYGNFRPGHTSSPVFHGPRTIHRAPPLHESEHQDANNFVPPRKKTRPTRPIIPPKKDPTFEIEGQPKRSEINLDDSEKRRAIQARIRQTPRKSPTKIGLWTELRDPTKRRRGRKQKPTAPIRKRSPRPVKKECKKKRKTIREMISK